MKRFDTVFCRGMSALQRIWPVLLLLLPAVILTADAQQPRRNPVGRASGQGKGKVMNEAQSRIISMLRLPDDEYFAVNRTRIREMQIEMGRITGGDPLADTPATDSSAVIAVGAPKIVKLAERDDIPLLVALSQTGQRAWEVIYDQNAWIIATDLKTGAVRYGRPFFPGKREMTPEPSRSGAPPDEINATATINSVRLINLREMFDGEWQPGRLALSVIVYDWLSNTVVVELQGKKGKTTPLSPGRASGFLDNADAVAALTGVGVRVTIPNRVAAKAPVPVQAALKLPRNLTVVVPDAASKAPLLRATLLLLQLDDKWPVQVDLTVPVVDSRNAGKEPVVEGRFAFDLRAAVPDRPLSGKYLAYLVVGSNTAGPYPIVVE